MKQLAFKLVSGLFCSVLISDQEASSDVSFGLKAIFHLLESLGNKNVKCQQLVSINTRFVLYVKMTMAVSILLLMIFRVI